jgi:hypothetical protein
MLKLMPPCVLTRFVLGDISNINHSVEVRAEGRKHRDFAYVNCLEGDGNYKQFVGGCKIHRWFRYAIRRFPSAEYYGRCEDDHYVQFPLLAYDLVALRGHRMLNMGYLLWFTFNDDAVWNGVENLQLNSSRKNQPKQCYITSGCGPHFSRCPLLDAASISADMGRRTVERTSNQDHVFDWKCKGKRCKADTRGAYKGQSHYKCTGDVVPNTVSRDPWEVI